jgi:hypothetical protein
MPRRNLGRQARKRRKKALEIEAVAFSLVRAATTVTTTNMDANVNANTNTNEGVTTIRTTNNRDVEDNNVTNNNSILPTDRSYVSDDVKTRTQLVERDRIDLIRQLGYLPGNALQVVTRVKDVFSSEDIQRLFSAVVVTSTDDDESATIIRNGSISNGIRSSRITNNNNNNNNNNNIKSSSKTKITAAMVQSMMDEPLVVKLYPLALRDESSSTKRRRKRRRDQKEEQQDDMKTTGDDEDTASKSKPIDTSLATISLTPLMEPFPTIYWVTNPLIKVLISKLELDRLGSQFEQRLVEGEKEERKFVGQQQQHEDGRDKHDNSQNNNNNNNNNNTPSLTTPLEAMQRAHKSYGNERRQLLSTRDMDYVRQRRWDESAFSENCGVAGIRNPKAVKCLHAHAAHYWSGNSDNIVGRWVEERLKSGRFLFC